MKKYIKYVIVILLIMIVGAVIYYTIVISKYQKLDNHIKGVYTCPMPQDSFFSDQPGECPKCGMTLVKTEDHGHTESSANMTAYTCPMPEDSVFSDKPGICPKCGMTLVKVEQHETYNQDQSISYLLKPTNNYVIGKYHVTYAMDTSISGEINLPGVVEYDPNAAVNIATRASGRIEKMYINYKFQMVKKGQKLFDLYSPELLTEQQNYIFLITNDPENFSVINASKQKLLLYGITEVQIKQLTKSKIVNPLITIYSPESGIVVGTEFMDKASGNTMLQKNTTTESLTVKEGNYIKKGEVIFRLLNRDKIWGIFNVVQSNGSFIQVNQPIFVTTEMVDIKPFAAKINHIETRFDSGDKTNGVRVYLNNSQMKLPIGLRLEGRVKISPIKGIWIKKQSMVSTGDQHIVFVKNGNGFKAKDIETGIELEGYIQVLGGISIKDQIVQNAQYLMDSESFIKSK
ncbi:MAG: efflux RND transporter periplasmic adaptor subunit [Saprospiraceae bacterium]|jgi:Cu(I)/Ag(I) efflux system membrane fusion protein|nr:efflux RND transporter periplasmic adaptor subunit [Saprospiraceae bacterium]MBP6539613.1 efflux RND transporter periplasmic adaptor subunit [Saprospiraceae bacterium]MBP6568977.1 efflux RND transporter periplasmic adaptor subunit [Saprospiraceae bacterium]MBP9196356.1 efflux RND transporter periplasmic adaptor subunit [Saprospiraceae bacterium]